MAKKAKAAPARKPGDGRVVLVGDGLTLPDEQRAWLERRGYEVHEIAPLCVGQFVYLSPRASWWADDMWGMLEAVVKAREKEAKDG